MKKIITLMVAIFATFTVATAETFKLRLGVSEDTYVALGDPYAYFGNEGFLVSGANNIMLFRFDTASLPSDALVEGVKVVFQTPFPQNVGRIIQSHPYQSLWVPQKSWGETSTWNSLTAGGFTTSSGVIPAFQTDGQEFVFTDGFLINQFQSWADELQPNDGLVYKAYGFGTSINSFVFGSREGAPEYAPYAEVTYTSAVPEPTSAALLLGGLGLLLARRRR